MHIVSALQSTAQRHCFFSPGVPGIVLLSVFLEQDVIEQKQLSGAFSTCLLFSQMPKPVFNAFLLYFAQDDGYFHGDKDFTSFV